jgi:AraC family transcriptional regulator
MISCRMLHGIHASQRRFPPNATFRPDNTVHRDCVVLAGSFGDARERGTRRFTRGTAVFRPASERNLIRVGAAGMRSLTISISPDAGKELLEARVLAEKPLALKSSECLRLATRVIGEVASTLPSSAPFRAGLLLEILGQISRPASNGADNKPVWLRAVVARVGAEFRDPASVPDYASWANVHSVTLARAFRKHEGVTIGEFIRYLRLECAAELLVNSADDLTRIALESGFADHAHMTRWFRRCFDATPSAYRRVRPG